MRTLLALALAVAFGPAALAQDLSAQARDTCFKEEQALKQAVIDKMKAIGAQNPADTGQAYERFEYWAKSDGWGKCLERRIAQTADQEDGYGRVEK